MPLQSLSLCVGVVAAAVVVDVVAPVLEVELVLVLSCACGSRSSSRSRRLRRRRRRRGALFDSPISFVLFYLNFSGGRRCKRVPSALFQLSLHYCTIFYLIVLMLTIVLSSIC